MRTWVAGGKLYACRDDSKGRPHHAVMRGRKMVWLPHVQGSVIEPLFEDVEYRLAEYTDRDDHAERLEALRQAAFS